VIDNVVWTNSWPSIAGAGCSLICVGAGEEWVRKVYALRGLRGVERQVGLTRGTWWPAGSSAGRIVARKSRRSRRSESVQGCGSQPESAHRVCGGSPQNRRVTWLSHKTKTGGSTGGDRIPGVPRSFDAGGRVAGSQGLRREDTVCDEEECYMTHLTLWGLYHNLNARGSVVFCLARRELIYISSRVSRQTIHPDCFLFPCSIGLDFFSVCKESYL
jgi:hypothetical protein